jgi:Uma2 family endonuclease
MEKTMALDTHNSTIGTLLTELDNLILDLYPRQGEWTEEEYLDLTDNTRQLIEFTDGYVEVLPIPTDTHQAILAYLYRAFFAIAGLANGTVRFSPLRVRIRGRKFREPDLVLVLDAKDPRRQNRYWQGADLALEVVSADKPERDLVEKRGDYAEAGIPEYWIVNPETETITVLCLEDTVYAEHGVFGRGAEATSVLLPGFTVQVEKVFDAD